MLLLVLHPTQQHNADANIVFYHATKSNSPLLEETFEYLRVDAPSFGLGYTVFNADRLLELPIGRASFSILSEHYYIEGSLILGVIIVFLPESNPENNFTVLVVRGTDGNPIFLSYSHALVLQTMGSLGGDLTWLDGLEHRLNFPMIDTYSLADGLALMNAVILQPPFVHIPSNDFTLETFVPSPDTFFTSGNFVARIEGTWNGMTSGPLYIFVASVGSSDVFRIPEYHLLSGERLEEIGIVINAEVSTEITGSDFTTEQTIETLANTAIIDFYNLSVED